MPRYRVVRQERWEQVVFIDAFNPEQARQRAAQGYGVIESDPEFVDYIYKEDWDVARIHKEKGQEELEGVGTGGDPTKEEG